MCAEKTSNADKSFKDALEFMQFVDTPTMKELTTKFRRLSLEYHPDKNQNKVEAKEKFQELLRCFKLIGDFIVNNVSNATMDEEEEDA